MQRQLLGVKLRDYFFPEQRSQTPSLLGHSPQIVNATILCQRKSNAERTVQCVRAPCKRQWGGLGACLNSLLEYMGSTEKLLKSLFAPLVTNIWTPDIWERWNFSNVHSRFIVCVLGWICTITSCRKLCRERFCLKMWVFFFGFGRGFKGKMQVNNL